MVKATSSGDIIQQSEKAMWKHIYINIYTLMFIHWMVLSKKKGRNQYLHFVTHSITKLPIKRIN